MTLDELKKEIIKCIKDIKNHFSVCLLCQKNCKLIN